MMAMVESLAAGTSPVVVGTIGSLLAGLLSGVGALPVLLGRRRASHQDALLGFAAGVMLAATAYSLMLPAIERGAEIYGFTLAAAAAASIGMLLGAAAIALVHARIPHEHFVKGQESGAEAVDTGRIARLWLFVIAITLHNFPEGLAVGVGFGGGDLANGTALAIGIGLQNAPEGLAVAVALLAIGYSRWRATGVAFLTGLVEPVGGLIGAAGVSLAAPLLPVGLAFAGGAMLYVISHEIIPETHRRGGAAIATAGLLVGFVTMMNLDVLLG